MGSDAQDLAERLKRIADLTERFLSVHDESLQARAFAERIKREIALLFPETMPASPKP